MKKVTLTFIVPNHVLVDAENELGWGNYANAVTILDEGCVESNYDVADCKSLTV